MPFSIQFDRRCYARDGAGGYTLPYPTFTPNTLADADQVTANNADLTTAMAASLAKDGQTVPTANLPMGSYKHTGVAQGTALTEYADVKSVQNSTYIWCGTAGGTADAITLTPTPAITAYVTGQKFRWKASANANTGAATVAISGLTTKALELDDSALSAGDHEANKYYEGLYDGTAFQITRLSPAASLVTSDIGVTVQAYDTDIPTVAASQAEMEAGTEAALRSMSPLRVAQAIASLGSSTFVQQVSTQTGAVATGTTLVPLDDTIPQNTEGDEYMTLAITPTSASNKLEISVVIQLAASATGVMTAALFQDSTASALAALQQQATPINAPFQLGFTHVMTAGTTSATTFKVRAGNHVAGTTTFNGIGGTRYLGGILASSIVIKEIEP